METRDQRIAEAKRAIRAASIDGVLRRSVAFEGVEVRAAGDGGYSIVGHGAVFNSLSENLGGFREKIAPGAFASVLAKSPDVRALYNHDPNLVLARTTNGTLRLEEDVAGLRYHADVVPTSYGNDLRLLLERGDVTQSSFAFRVADDVWDEDPDTGALIRTIHEFSALYDVSPVTYPAYPAADSGLAGSAPAAERGADGLSDEERGADGDGGDEQAEDWRLAHVRRSMSGLKLTGVIPSDL